MSDLPYITKGESSSACLDSGLVCSIDPRTGKCSECGKAESDGPCSCWVGRPIFHEGHCCFREDPRPLDEIGLGDTPPCGHWHPDVPRPAGLDALTEAIQSRTGGKALGEMTGAEIQEAFADGPVISRGGKVVEP